MMELLEAYTKQKIAESKQKIAEESLAYYKNLSRWQWRIIWVLLTACGVLIGLVLKGGV